MIVNVRCRNVVRVRGPGDGEIRQFQGQRIQHFSAESERGGTKNDSEDTGPERRNQLRAKGRRGDA